jgi:hypothetical protein
MSEDWRVDSHDKAIEKLKDDLREAKSECWKGLREQKTELRKDLEKVEKKIWALEDRPIDWLLKAMPVILAALLGAYLALVIAGVIHKH